jgi:excisionase family DNA binding protein
LLAFAHVVTSLLTDTRRRKEVNMTEEAKAYPRGISLKEAWERIGVKKTRFYELLHEGEIESYHVGKRHLIVDASLNAWIDRNRTTPLKV